MANELTLSNVPPSTVVGKGDFATVTNNTGSAVDWSLSANPPGLMFSPSGGKGLADGASSPVTITPMVAAQFLITLSSTVGVPLSGSPVFTVAVPAAIDAYNELKDDLKSLEF